MHAEGDLERAKALFNEGRALAAKGSYSEACGRFEESLKLEPGMGTRFNLADCWEHVGRAASAQALFLQVAADAHASGLRDRERLARARAAGLEPRLSRLVIEVTEERGLTVRRNRVVVEPSVWGAAVPLDPGFYDIEASAPSKATWTKRVQVSASEPVLFVTIPPLGGRTKATAAAAPIPGQEPALEPKVSAELEPEAVDVPRPRPTGAKAPAPSARSTPQGVSPAARALTLGLGVVGLAGAATGTVFALKFKASNDDARAVCSGGGVCTQADLDRHADLAQDARAARTGAYIGFGIGGAALLAATVVYLSPGMLQTESTGFAAAPLVAADGSWGLAAQGRF